MVVEGGTYKNISPNDMAIGYGSECHDDGHLGSVSLLYIKDLSTCCYSRALMELAVRVSLEICCCFCCCCCCCLCCCCCCCRRLCYICEQTSFAAQVRFFFSFHFTSNFFFLFAKRHRFFFLFLHFCVQDDFQRFSKKFQRKFSFWTKGN